MLRVGGRQKRALMMIEPPGHPRRAGIFEIHDRVFIAIKKTFGERLRGAMSHACVMEFGLRGDAFAEKAGKNGRRSGAVEAPVMETETHRHRVSHAILAVRIDLQINRLRPIEATKNGRAR
jgi:hypothetical protein